MLEADRHTKILSVACDRCRMARSEGLGTDRDAAMRVLVAEGWHEAAQRGVGRPRWQWWCPACKPRTPKKFGCSLTTTDFDMNQGRK